MVTGKVDQVEVHLPYWMAYAEGMADLSERLEVQWSAKTIFDPMVTPFQKDDDGLPIRGFCLAALAKEEYKRAKEGMLQKLAETGHWA